MKPLSLTRSGDFRRVYSDGKRTRRNGIGVAVRDRKDDASPRVGYTVTRSAGPAVSRNRIKRRLRAAVRTLEIAPGVDVVVSGDRDVARMDFQVLVEKLRTSLSSLGAIR